MARRDNSLLIAVWLLGAWTLETGCSSFATLEPAPVRQMTSALFDKAQATLQQAPEVAIAALCSTKGQSFHRGVGDGGFAHSCLNAERFLEVTPWLIDVQGRGDVVELISIGATMPEDETQSLALVAALSSQAESQCNERHQEDDDTLLFSGCTGSYAVAAVLRQRLKAPQMRVTVALASHEHALDIFWAIRGQR